MTAARTALASLLAVGALTLLACGGAAPGAPPASPSKAMPPSGTDGLQEDQKEGESQGGAEPVTPTPTTEPKPAIAGLDQAESELGRAETDLASALSSTDCKTICKAFASMQRAADRICELNGPDDPGARCARARAERDEARERVRRACGSCS